MKLFKYIGLSCLGVALNSCADFIDNAPDDTLTMEMVFNDKVRTEDWLSGVYNKIPDPYWDLMRSWGYDTMGDEAAPSQRWHQWWGNSLNFLIGQWYTNSTWDASIWNDCPQRIRSAYLFLENVKPLPEQSQTAEDVEKMKDECRFLIAYYYWLMLEAYGGVPFFDGLADVNDPNLMRGQKTFDEMVDWIDKEMYELAQPGRLPDSWLGESQQYYGRATSIAALAVRARMLLFAASPLVNGNEWYKGFENYDGKERFNSTYDPKKWERAATACKELIDRASAAGHKLIVTKNDDGSIDPFMSCYNVYMLRGDVNTEALFIRSQCDWREFERHSTPRGAQGNGGLGIYQDLVDVFAMKDGSLPITGYRGEVGGEPIINPASGYTESGFSTENDVRKTKFNLYRNRNDVPVDESRDGAVWNTVAEKGTYNMYVNREPRFYLTVIWNGQWYHQANRKTEFMSGQQDGGTTHDAPQYGYLLRKRIPLDSNPRDNIHPQRPGILYRLGEAYLNYAEAQWHVNPQSKDIITYLNMIRSRAGVPEYSANGVPAGKDQNGFQRIVLNNADEIMKAIRHERRVELCCEDGLRYFDLRRWKEAEETLNKWMYGMNFGGTKFSDDKNDPASFFVRTRDLQRKYERKFYWYPIFQDEIDKDPTLRQAPFWDKE